MDIDWSLLGDAPLALAVSGGADSFALLHASHARGLPVVALTVDHGLREGSAADACVVAAWCAERGVPHETLRWEGGKPQTGVQAAARAARYRLLCEACERLGLDRLATGHTMDDQAETVFMRLRRGAGRGLAGMPPARKIASGPGEPVDLLRPMLCVRRAEARAYAEEQGLPVRDDPGNDDEGFERVRVRAVLGALEEQGLLTAEALARVAETQQTANREFLAAVTVQISQWWAVMGIDGTERTEWGKENADWIFSPPWEGEGPTDSEKRVVALLIGSVGSGSPNVDWNGQRHLVIEGAIIERLSEEGGQGKRLWRARSQPLRSPRFAIYREPAALLGRADGTPGLAPVPAAPGSRHLFDRRFVVIVPENAASSLVLRPLGQLMPRDIATSTLARARVSTLPVLSEGERIALLPDPAERAVREALSGWKGSGDLLQPEGATFPARSLLAERFANEVIRY